MTLILIGIILEIMFLIIAPAVGVALIASPWMVIISAIDSSILSWKTTIIVCAVGCFGTCIACILYAVADNLLD